MKMKISATTTILIALAMSALIIALYFNTQGDDTHTHISVTFACLMMILAYGQRYRKSR